ncbi:MAG: LptF/LptG family permease [Alphaproteobacteria bacterium]|nr:LptF/LptG family permease [Alphaproteobacteria bacterium]MCB1551376.1 LptF/LptG family permease [Alphaproteobacteria bacterium]MCB9985568.1 LptF/LptG family permease [Micavibrio sp.]HPQ50971.1 LptF/LptG family permease [Alphaproteobacteria bacterium]HRK98286.1 LptF/LptG family permease [Alphaproteobacteria bacterium]
MQIIDRYIFRQMLIATIFIVVILAVLVLLTQSLRYLELVMSAGASGLSFWLVTLLSLPSFFEVILPIGVVAAILFIYHRLVMDSELFVMKALGFSPLRLARPALILAVGLGFGLFVVMGWIAPTSKASAILMRKDIKAQMSSLIFREGVFTQAGDGLTLYIRDRDYEGNLLGLVIHDARDKDQSPSTVIASRGVLVSADSGHQVLVYDGSRQQYDAKSGVLKRLDFDRYTIDLPEETQSTPIRRKEPDERVLQSLIHSEEAKTDRSVRRAYRLEVQKRFLTPLLIPALAMVALVALLIGSHDRRGQTTRIIGAVSAVVVIEVLYLISYNLAKTSSVGFALMLLTVMIPILGGVFMLMRDRILLFLLKSSSSESAGAS